MSLVKDRYYSLIVTERWTILTFCFASAERHIYIRLQWIAACILHPVRLGHQTEIISRRVRSQSDIHLNNIDFLLMKLFSLIMVLAGLLIASACNVQNPQHTSSARAAYGNAAPDFKAHKKKNQKKQRRAVRDAKRKNTPNNRLYFHRRPY